MRKTVLLVALMSLLALGGQSFAELCTVDAAPAATLLLSLSHADVSDGPILRDSLPWYRIVWGVIILLTLGGFTAITLLFLAVLYTTLEVLNKSSPLMQELVSRIGDIEALLHSLAGDISHAREEALRNGQVWQAWWIPIASIPTIVMNVSLLPVMAVRDRALGILRIEVS